MSSTLATQAAAQTNNGGVDDDVKFLEAATWSNYECDCRVFEVLVDRLRGELNLSTDIHGVALPEGLQVPSHFRVLIIENVYFICYFNSHRGNRGSGVYMSKRKAEYLFRRSG